MIFHLLLLLSHCFCRVFVVPFIYSFDCESLLRLLAWRSFHFGDEGKTVEDNLLTRWLMQKRTPLTVVPHQPMHQLSPPKEGKKKTASTTIECYRCRGNLYATKCKFINADCRSCGKNGRSSSKSFQSSLQIIKVCCDHIKF